MERPLAEPDDEAPLRTEASCPALRWLAAGALTGLCAATGALSRWPLGTVAGCLLLAWCLLGVVAGALLWPLVRCDGVTAEGTATLG